MPVTQVVGVRVPPPAPKKRFVSDDWEFHAGYRNKIRRPKPRVQGGVAGQRNRGKDQPPAQGTGPNRANARVPPRQGSGVGATQEIRTHGPGRGPGTRRQRFFATSTRRKGLAAGHAAADRDHLVRGRRRSGIHHRRRVAARDQARRLFENQARAADSENRRCGDGKDAGRYRRRPWRFGADQGRPRNQDRRCVDDRFHRPGRRQGIRRRQGRRL